jgi:hypothetical protein
MDETLDQLITNAKALRDIPPSKLEVHELDALQRTQESLLAHLMHLDGVLNEKIVPKKPLQEKAAVFQGLNQNLQKRFRIKRRSKLQKS